MTRRFRRRPSATLFLCAALVVVIVARYAYDRILERRTPAGGEILQAGRCDVVRVVDGDTLVVRQTVTRGADGRRTSSEATVRLLGIDCPEFDEPRGSEATALARRLLGDGVVTLRFDRRRLDRYERFLAYVYVDQQLVNETLVRAGLARVDVYPGDSQSFDRIFRKAEAEAKSARRGIWSR